MQFYQPLLKGEKVVNASYENGILTNHDTGEQKQYPSRGKKPTWVKEWESNNNNMGLKETQFNNEGDGMQNEEAVVVNESRKKSRKVGGDKVTTVIDICKERLAKTMAENKVFFKGELLNFTNIKNIRPLYLKFVVEQTSPMWMFYNKDFNGNQKIAPDGSTLHISEYCWNRSLFGSNHIQNMKDFKDWMENLILFRGGIITVEKKSKGKNNDVETDETEKSGTNGCLQRNLVTLVEVNKFESFEEDRLGNTAKDIGEEDKKQSTNHLDTVTKYRGLMATITHQLNVREYFDQMCGKDYAQPNMYKFIHEYCKMNEDDMRIFSEHLVPVMQDGYLNIDTLVDYVRTKYDSFSFVKGGVDGDFIVTSSSINDFRS